MALQHFDTKHTTTTTSEVQYYFDFGRTLSRLFIITTTSFTFFTFSHDTPHIFGMGMRALRCEPKNFGGGGCDFVFAFERARCRD
jgi:hypothetical protein